MFGGYLASIDTEEKPLELIFFCRKDHREAINKKGLELHAANRNLLLTNIKAYENAEEFIEASGADSIYKFDYLFLTTKAWKSVV